MVFEKKLSSLMDTNKGTENQFLKEGMKETSVVQSGNGAKKYNTSGNDFVDNFAAISYFKEPRSYKEVAKDMELLWSLDPKLCLKLAVYIRLITRKSKVVKDDGSIEELEVQRGQGLKNEGIMRMLWLAINQPKTFKANFAYFVAAGSWKDVFQMLSLDLQYHGWEGRKLDWNFFFLVIAAGFTNPETTHLVRKYMPTIRTNKNCKTVESRADTLIGRWIARKFSPDLEKESAYKAYRKMKSEGKAHQWQQLISQQLYDKINFDHIAGRALAILVGSEFLKNHNLTEKYSKWIQSKPVAKYTGFVFELFTPLGSGYHCYHIEDYKENTINAQFAQLVKTGPFANSFAEFADKCKLHQWKGNTPVDKYINDRCEAYGGTNFQSVIDLFINLKQRGVKEEDFPTGLLLVSDGELNPAGYGSGNNSTNFQTAIRRLKEAGFSEEYVKNFKLIMWDIPNYYYGSGNAVKFEDFADAPNFFYMSGYDPSAVAFIMGTGTMKRTPKNAEELFMVAMDQDLLNRLQVVVNKPKRKTSKKK